MCFAIEPLKNTFRKPCEIFTKSLNFRNISQNSSVFALPSKGGRFFHTEGNVNSPLRRVVQILSKIREMRCFSPYFARRFAAKCTIFCKLEYNSHFSVRFAIISNFCFRKPGDAHLDMPRRQWGGDEAFVFSIGSSSRNDLAPELDVSALLATISLPCNLPEVTPQRQLEYKLSSIWKKIVVHNCLPDRQLRSRKIE